MQFLPAHIAQNTMHLVTCNVRKTIALMKPEKKEASLRLKRVNKILQIVLIQDHTLSATSTESSWKSTWATYSNYELLYHSIKRFKHCTYSVLQIRLTLFNEVILGGNDNFYKSNHIIFITQKGRRHFAPTGRPCSRSRRILQPASYVKASLYSHVYRIVTWLKSLSETLGFLKI